MPGRDGLDVARALRDRRSATRVIVLTLHKDAWFLNAALDAGVHGYVPKESAATEIAGALRKRARRPAVRQPGALEAADQPEPACQRARERAPALDALTPTEMKVLRLVAEVKTTKDIAAALCISPRTVEHHRTSIATKLDLHGAHALTRFAVKHQSALRDP